MKHYTAIVSKDTTGKPEDTSANLKVKVRVPYFHGPKTRDDYANSSLQISNQYWVDDSGLPWAEVIKPINATGEFIADEYFEEDDLVMVEAVNDDINNLIIIGKIGNFGATSDSTLAQSRLDGTASDGIGGVDGSGSDSFPSGDSLISVAKSQIGTKDDGNNKVKYNTEYYGRAVSGSGYAWCCAFVWWCFKQAGLSQYFYGGSKTAHCETLRNYHKDKGENISSNYKAGDILFFNWTSNKGKAQHVGIAIEDQNGNTIKTVEGNTSGSGSQSYGGHVMEKTRKMSQIVGGYRPGKSSSVEEQCFNYFTKTMGLNTAAACGIMGNIFYESSFRPTASGDSGTSYGLCQWHKGRFDNLRNYCNQQGTDYKSAVGQLQYLEYELSNSYSYVLNSIKNVSNTETGAGDAAEVWCRRFEIPANVDNEVNKKRKPKAKEYFKKYK